MTVFDAKYFRTTLAAQAKAIGGEPTVEVHLINGQSHRIRAVAEVTDGYVVLDVHQRRAETIGSKTHWTGDASSDMSDIMRAVVSFESIAQVVIVPPEAVSTPRIGFGAIRT